MVSSYLPAVLLPLLYSTVSFSLPLNLDLELNFATKDFSVFRHVLVGF